MEALQKDLYGSYVAEVAGCEEKMQSANMSCDRCIDSSEGVAIKFCCDCSMFLCSWCTKDHTRLRVTHKHELVDVGEKKEGQQDKSLLNTIARKVMNCQLHSDEELKFYCTSCSLLICRDCVLVSHSDHSYDRIEATAEKEKSDLLVVIDESDDATTKLENAMAKGEKVIQNIKTKQQSVDEEIRECFKNLVETLHCREESLLARSSEVGLTKVTALMLQIEELKKNFNEISRVRGYIKEAVHTYTPAEMLSAKKAMTIKLASLIKQFNACSLNPCRNDMVCVKFDTASIDEEIKKFGIVTGGCNAATSTASLYIPQAIEGKVKTVSIITRDTQGKPFLHGGDDVKVKLGLISNNEFDVKGIVEDNENGTYEVSVTPQTTGEHQLDITIGNEHIQSSPFIISVREERPYTSQTCLKSYQVSSPWDVAFSKEKGEIFVASYSDHSIHCIPVVDQEGKVPRRIGTSGTSKLQFSNPTGIAIHGEMVYVVEYRNHRVQKFTISGESISIFGSEGSGDGQLDHPRGICIDPYGKIYVSECGNNRISVFNADESFDRHITVNLSNPWGLAFDSSGNLYVANHNSHNIAIFDPKGEAKGNPYEHENIKNPAGMAIDPEGYMYINTYSSGNMFVLDPQFQIINTISGFQQTTGIVLDDDGYCYVCDYSNGKVKKY